MQKKILTVIGARPQFIKAAVISRNIYLSDSSVREVLVHTGQHYDQNMSEIFFKELKIPQADFNLGIGGGGHGQNTGRMLEALEKVMLSERPDWVLVYGDTDSTLAGAIAAAKLHIPIAHIEAGLRSFNRRMPEEINRVLTDHVSTLLFAPSDSARNKLIAEGISASKIHVVGDVMYDAALFYQKSAVKPIWFDSSGVAEGAFILCTLHRAENTDSKERLHSIFEGLRKSGLNTFLPLHPRTKDRIASFNIPIPDNVKLIDPLGYLEMVWMEKNCLIVATDSGGVQKEAFFHGKRCVTMRDETEWIELVDAGFNTLTGANSELIASALGTSPAPINLKTNIYGDGNAGGTILSILCGKVDAHDARSL